MKHALFSFVALIAMVVVVLGFAHRGPAPAIALLTAVCLLAAACSAALAFRAEPEVQRSPHALPSFALLVPLASGALFFVCLRNATLGKMPTWTAGAAVTCSFVALWATCALTWSKLRGDGSGLRALFTPSTAIVLFASLLALPTLGQFGLTDPWETHYAEVAREILARDDAISTYWANEGWFTSKPILIFWLEAISMALAGVNPLPGNMLSGHAHPEWAIRFPHFLLALVGSLVLYAGVARAIGRRRALVGALVLWSMPQWILLSRQAITDMALCASLCASVGFVLLAFHTHERKPARRVQAVLGGAHLTISAADLLNAVLFLFVASQAMYLLSRNIDVAHGLRADVVHEGSFGTCGVLPSHPPCAPHLPSVRRLTPMLQGFVLLGVLAGLMSRVSVLTEQRSVYLLSACVAAAVGAMAKGPLALVLPATCTLIALVATKRLRMFLSFDFAVPVLGLVVVSALVLPWYVATYARHGRLFYDELVLRHMLGRTLSHLHDTNEGDDTSLRYYVGQLGYAVVPIVTLLPGALVHALRAQKNVTRTLLLSWALSAFALVTVMGTKFHHYIFPAVPPLAFLVGDFLETRTRTTAGDARTWQLVAALFGAALAARLAHDLVATQNGIAGPSRIFSLVCYRYDRVWPASLHMERVFGVASVATIAGGLLVTLSSVRKLHIALFSAMGLFALYVSHSYMPQVAQHRGQRALFERIAAEAPNAVPVAYQLNWKGENFYSANRVAIFVSSGASFQNWIRAQPGPLYFVTEPSRISSLRAELPTRASLTRLTTDDENSAFVLLRADGL